MPEARRARVAETLVEDLARLGRLHLQVARLIDAAALGEHAARGRAGGGDFIEHRALGVGEALTRVDWRASARRDGLVVREQRAERRLEVVALVDSSASMSSGEPVSKWRYAQWLALGSAYAARRAGDAATLAVAGGDQSLALTLRSVAELPQCAAALEEVEAAGETDLSAALEQNLPRIGCGLLVVISDLLEADDAFWRQLAERVARGWHAVVIRVLAADEVHFEHRGSFRFEPLEGGAAVVVDAGAIRAAYLEELRRFDAQCAAAAAAAGARWIRCHTGQSPIEPLRQLLEGALR